MIISTVPYVCVYPLSQPPPSIFGYHKQSKNGGGKGLEMCAITFVRECCVSHLSMKNSSRNNEQHSYHKWLWDATLPIDLDSIQFSTYHAWSLAGFYHQYEPHCSMIAQLTQLTGMPLHYLSLRHSIVTTINQSLFLSNFPAVWYTRKMQALWGEPEQTTTWNLLLLLHFKQLLYWIAC